MVRTSPANADTHLGVKTLAGLAVLLVLVSAAYAVWAVGIRALSVQLHIPALVSHTVNRSGGILIALGMCAAAVRTGVCSLIPLAIVLGGAWLWTRTSARAEV